MLVFSRLSILVVGQIGNLCWLCFVGDFLLLVIGISKVDFVYPFSLSISFVFALFVFI